MHPLMWLPLAKCAVRAGAPCCGGSEGQATEGGTGLAADGGQQSAAVHSCRR